MNSTLTKGGDVQGIALTGRDGAKLGTVRETFVDLASGHIEFLVVELASLLGGASKFHPIPWASVRHDPVANAFQAQMTKDEFKASPSYDREQLATTDYGWNEQSARYFSGFPGA